MKKSLVQSFYLFKTKKKQILRAFSLIWNKTWHSYLNEKQPLNTILKFLPRILFSMFYMCIYIIFPLFDTVIKELQRLKIRCQTKIFNLKYTSAPIFHESSLVWYPLLTLLKGTLMYNMNLEWKPSWAKHASKKTKKTYCKNY